jgi:hypothetical protein
MSIMMDEGHRQLSRVELLENPAPRDHVLPPQDEGFHRIDEPFLCLPEELGEDCYLD